MDENEPQEIEANVNGMRVIVTSEGIVFTGSIGQVLSDPVDELRSALQYINQQKQEIELLKWIAFYAKQYRMAINKRPIQEDTSVFFERRNLDKYLDELEKPTS